MVQADNLTPHKAASYDSDVRQTIPFYEIFHRQTIDLVKTARPDVERWLDTGCGTGYLIEKALPHFPQAQFILTDPSEAMLAQAQERLKGADSGRVRFLPPLGSAQLTHLPCPAPQVVTAIMSHHYLQAAERAEASRACFRLLADKGLFVTFENIDPLTSEGRTIALERWGRFQVEEGRPLSVAEEHRKRFQTKYFPISVEAHLRLFRKIGFAVAELFWYSQMQAGFYAIKK